MCFKQTGSLIVVVLMCCVVASPVIGQDAQQQNDGQRRSQRGDRGGPRGDRGGRGDRGDRGSRGDRWGRGGPGRGAPTPEQRDRFYDEMVQRHMERMTETYELSEQQQAQARARLEEIKVEQKATSDVRRQQFDSLRTEMGQLRDSARDGGQFNSQRASEIEQQMRSMWESAPLMNRDKVAGEIEKLLPADQVEKGRARRAQQDAEHQQQHEEMRRQWEQRRQERGAQAGPDGQDSQNDWGRRRGFRDRQDGSGQAQDQDSQNLQMSAQQPAPPIVENPIGPWERYVRDFTRRYKLDDSQKATAASILREMQERRTGYEDSKREKYEAANQIEDQAERQRQLDALNRPVVYLFDQLKARLDRIPTTEQRKAAGDSPRTPASMPAANTTKPAS